MIAGAEAELGHRVSELLTRERLLAAGAKLTTYSTPRRLAVLVEGVLASQANTEEQLTGPSWKVAFKDGAPTGAAEAFAKNPTAYALAPTDRHAICIAHCGNGNRFRTARSLRCRTAKPSCRCRRNCLSAIDPVN